MDLINQVLPFGSAFVSGLLALFALYRDRHLFVHQIFAAGMIIYAAEAVMTGLCLSALMPGDVRYCLGIRSCTTALIPGTWLLFSLCFSRKNYKDIIAKYKWLVIILYALPLLAATLFQHAFFIEMPHVSISSFWLVRIGWAGHVFYISILLATIIILMNLERTLRNSIGHHRWQIKFMILGIGCLFAVRIYTISQTILFHSVDLALEVANSAAILIGCFFIVKSLLRTRRMDVRFYMSQTFIFNSITVLFIGIYLISVGLLTQITIRFTQARYIPLKAFIILLALLGLFMFILSDRMRRSVKRFVSRHFERPFYDYRKEWAKFTKNTTSVTDIKSLCDIVVKMVSRTFDTLSVTIWVCNDKNDSSFIGATTTFSDTIHDDIEKNKSMLADFIKVMQHKNIPYDLDYRNRKVPKELQEFDVDFFNSLKIRYCLPLKAGEKLLGLMTVDDVVGNNALTIEDFDLLKTMSDQVASELLNLMLAEDLKQAKEMEALQTMSAFFIHDLKNLASKLSLTMQNLPVHYENPEFRQDAIKTMSQSIEKINLMSSRLTTLSEKIDINPTTSDLNQLIQDTLADLNGSFGGNIAKNLRTLPKVSIDTELIKKVLTNLLLNAYEASDRTDNIIVSTERKEGWAIFSVQDFGSGMSREFIEKSLFQPFKTTKQKGMGIGLYHSKLIIDAHKGKIEVETEQGKGSMFRVMLPVKTASMSQVQK